MNQKIRPPSPKEIREEGEAGLPELVRAPDPGGRFSDPDAVDASSGAPVGPFSPLEAVQLRRDMNEPNRAYGRPYVPNAAELLLQEYNEAFAAVKAAYAGTRDEPPALRIRYLKAREAMIDAGLMQGDK